MPQGVDHATSLVERLPVLLLRVGVGNDPAAAKKARARIASGEAQLVIGTHSLIQEKRCMRRSVAWRSEVATVRPDVDLAADAAEALLRDGLEPAQNRFHALSG